MTLALELYRSITRYVAARAVRGRIPGALAGPVAPLRLVNRSAPRLPAAGWTRVRPLLSGICGSDLATLSGRSSFYFSPLVSMPFVPGHEVVGETLDDVDGLAAGTRVIVDPVLSCEPRGLRACGWCASGQPNRCDQVTAGHIAPGLQIGYCADTGGGWGQQLVAHRSQLHAVPEGIPDEEAVLVEPLACAVHAVRRAQVLPGDTVLLVGAGTVGLFTLLALRELTQAGAITVVAKHAHQRAGAERLGATEVVGPDRAMGALRRSSRALLMQPERGQDYLLGGVDVAFDCVGSSATMDLAVRGVRAGGRVVLAGLPTSGGDLTPVWYRELELVGAYGSGGPGGGDSVGVQARPSFEVALDLAGTGALKGLVGATYGLSEWREALDHAFAAGRLGTFKVAFDPNRE